MSTENHFRRDKGKMSLEATQKKYNEHYENFKNILDGSGETANKKPESKHDDYEKRYNRYKRLIRGAEENAMPNKPILVSRQEVSASRDFVEIDEDRDKESTFKIERAYKSKEASAEDDKLKMTKSLGR